MSEDAHQNEELPPEPKITAICGKCDAEFTEEQIKGKNECPSCGTKNIPLDPKDEVTIKINTHWLRVLGVWAENYASHMDHQHADETEERLMPVVDKIAQIIEAQLPPEQWTPITLTRELKNLKEELGHDVSIKLIRGDGEEFDL
jgi:hypothetical protein